MYYLGEVYMEKAFKKLMLSDKDKIKFDKGKQLESVWDDYRAILYIHYSKNNEIICTIYFDFPNDKLIIRLSDRNYSYVDAQNVTGLIRCIGLGSIDCYAKRHRLFLSNDGERKDKDLLIMDVKNLYKKLTYIVNDKWWCLNEC